MWVVVDSEMVGRGGAKRREKATFLTKLSHVPGATPGGFPVSEIDSVWLGLPNSVLSYSAAYELRDTNVP